MTEYPTCTPTAQHHARQPAQSAVSSCHRPCAKHCDRRRLLVASGSCGRSRKSHLVIQGPTDRSIPGSHGAPTAKIQSQSEYTQAHVEEAGKEPQTTSGPAAATTAAPNSLNMTGRLLKQNKLESVLEMKQSKNRNRK